MTRSMMRKILLKKIVCFLHLSKLLSVEGRSIIPKLPNETSILVKISIYFLICYLRHKGQSTRLICSTVFASSRKMNVCIGFEINLVCILSPLVCDSNSIQISLYMILSLSFRSQTLEKEVQRKEHVVQEEAEDFRRVMPSDQEKCQGFLLKDIM